MGKDLKALYIWQLFFSVRLSTPTACAHRFCIQLLPMSILHAGLEKSSNRSLIPAFFAFQRKATRSKASRIQKYQHLNKENLYLLKYFIRNNSMCPKMSITAQILFGRLVWFLLGFGCGFLCFVSFFFVYNVTCPENRILWMCMLFPKATKLCTLEMNGMKLIVAVLIGSTNNFIYLKFYLLLPANSRSLSGT